METMRPIDADALLERLCSGDPRRIQKYCYPCKEVLEEIKNAPTVDSGRARRNSMIYTIAFNALLAFPLLWACLTYGEREEER